jgi:hypothetical protein
MKVAFWALNLQHTPPHRGELSHSALMLQEPDSFLFILFLHLVFNLVGKKKFKLNDKIKK